MFKQGVHVHLRVRSNKMFVRVHLRVCTNNVCAGVHIRECAQTALLSLTVRLLLSRKLDGTSLEAPSRFEFFVKLN